MHLPQVPVDEPDVDADETPVEAEVARDAAERAITKAFEGEYQAWIETIEKLEKQRKRAFDELWDRLGTGLRGAMKANPEWDRLESKQDLLRLYKMIMVALVAHGATDKSTLRTPMTRSECILERT